MQKKKALLEAALFMASQPLSVQELAGIINDEENTVKEILEEMRKEVLAEGRGIEVYQTEKGIELRVKDEFLPNVYHLTPHSDMGKGLLKALAIIAFKQPVKQSDIVKLIGNRTYEYIKELGSKNFIKFEKHGRTKKLWVSESFYQYFRLNKNDLEKMIKKKQDDEEKSDIPGPAVPDEGAEIPGEGEDKENLPEEKGPES